MLEQPTPASEPGPDAPRPDRARPASADLRRAEEPELVAALRGGDLLALAECWHRSAPAAHAVARRLLGAPDDIETVLGDLYAALWVRPPMGVSLERWARSGAFELGARLLRTRGQAPSAPSCALLLPDLPAARRPATDPVERVIAALTPEAALALVRAHDQGVPTDEQADATASAALDLALEALAQATVDAEGLGGAFDEPLGDLVLGVAEPARATALRDRLAAEPALAERVRFLRRGRRRMEGLPPAPELGPRVLLGVVARYGIGAAPAETGEERPGEAARLVIEEDVVITVARQSSAHGDATPRAAAVADVDTGPIALIAPPDAPAVAEDDLPPWPGETEHTGGWNAESDVEPRAARTPAAGPGVRRGVGLLLVGTALGMLVGALALVLR